MATPHIPSISPLRGLLEVTRLVRAEGDLPELLVAIARTVAESLGYDTVVVNLYRPAWDDFCVTTVHGNDDARAQLLGQVRSLDEWAPLLAERFCRRGAYVVPAGTFDWSACGYSYVPTADRSAGAQSWHPEDALFLPMRHTDGHLLGILSVDEPVHRMRPSDQELDVLVAVADHVALAVQAAQESLDSARHRLALGRLLEVSSSLTAEPVAEEILRAVCSGVREALGFQHVVAALREGDTGRLDVRAAVGRPLDEIRRAGPVFVHEIEGLLDAAFEVEGCFLVPVEEARRRTSLDRELYASELNGRGPRAWNRHWLLVPLRDSGDEVIGVLFADEPDDRLLPSREKLQALRVFANQAAAAVTASARLKELRFLADHDPLTRLQNRRAFVERVDGEVARALRYGHRFALVLGDLDGFKALNDRFGHAAGDEALQEYARTLQSALRSGDEAFRIGGDEFALLLAQATEEDARKVVGRVNGRARGLVHASFGAASCPQDASDLKELFRLADAALYAAKRDGSILRFAA